jgi:hypothetical protein
MKHAKPSRPDGSVLLLAAALLLAAPAPARAAPAEIQRSDTIHLDRPQGFGFVRPKMIDEGCLNRALAEEPAAAGLDTRARFMVQRDGSLTNIEFRPVVPTAMTQAALTALQSCPWSPGRDPEGEPVVVQVTQPLKVKAAEAEEEGVVRAGVSDAFSRPDRADAPGAPPPPVVMGEGSLRLGTSQAAGFRRPVPDDPACLARSLQGKRAAAGLDNKVKFAVMRDGSVSHFSFLAPVPAEVERVVVAAFEACPWKPALDPAGEPLAVWVVQPLKVAPMLPEPEKQRPLFP